MITTQKVTIGKSGGEFVIKTEGMWVLTNLTKKSDVQKVIKSSKAHQWLIDDAAKTPKATISKSNQLPTAATQSFVIKAFHVSVKRVIENLVEYEGVDIDAAIAQGNSLMLGNPVVANTDSVISSVKDALSYGRAAGIF